MWPTPSGNKLIEGKLANLLREAIDSMHKDLSQRLDDWDTNLCDIDAFNRLSAKQAMMYLAHSATMFFESKLVAELDCFTEAAIFAIFDYVRCSIEQEIGDEEENEDKCVTYDVFRCLTHGAMVEAGLVKDCSDDNWIDGHYWTRHLMRLSECVLDVHHLELINKFSETPQEQRDELCERFGALRAYFQVAPPRPKHSDLQRAISAIKRICRPLDEDDGGILLFMRGEAPFTQYNTWQDMPGNCAEYLDTKEDIIFAKHTDKWDPEPVIEYTHSLIKNDDNVVIYVVTINSCTSVEDVGRIPMLCGRADDAIFWINDDIEEFEHKLTYLRDMLAILKSDPKKFEIRLVGEEFRAFEYLLSSRKI
jgi:hypothetical protein